MVGDTSNLTKSEKGKLRISKKNIISSCWLSFASCIVLMFAFIRFLIIWRVSDENIFNTMILSFRFSVQLWNFLHHNRNSPNAHCLDACRDLCRRYKEKYKEKLKNKSLSKLRSTELNVSFVVCGITHLIFIVYNTSTKSPSNWICS